MCPAQPEGNTDMPQDAPFELPDLTGLDLTALQALEVQAVEAFTARYDAGATTPEDLQTLQTLAEAVQTVRAAVASATPEPESEPAPEPAAPAEPAAPVEPVAPVEPGPSEAEGVLTRFLEAIAKTTTPPAGATALPVAAVEPAAPPATPAVEPAPSSIAAAADTRKPEDVQLPVAEMSPIVITASADIPGIPAASAIDGWEGLVMAVGAKARAIPDQPGRMYPHPVASIEKRLDPERNLDGLSEKDQLAKFNDLSTVEYLVASGGWCAPSETIYDFACLVEAPPNMVVLPTFTTVRGGVRFPISPTFRDFKSLSNNGLFTWTEANDIAAATGSPTKPCFHVPCVTFAPDCRLELEGLCVTAGNLTDRAYPELVRRYLSLVLTAHLHRMNTRKIAKMLAMADNNVTLAETFGAAAPLLSGIELQVTDLRDQFSMSKTAVLEAMLPFWVRGLVRADIARRSGLEFQAVTDAEIDAWFSAANIAPQFVSDWQELGNPSVPALTWPTTVDILIWLPGAMRELTGPTLDIAVTRDSVQNATNDFTLAFTEESYQICKPGCGVRRVTIPVCPSGEVGARIELECPAA